jgi:hypothetical protein
MNYWHDNWFPNNYWHDDWFPGEPQIIVPGAVRPDPLDAAKKPIITYITPNEGIGVTVFSSLISGKRLIEELTGVAVSINTESAAIGGFWSATITLGISRAEAEDWITAGIDRHIEVVGSGGVEWEGFVNQIDATIGPITLVRGPLQAIANRVKIKYSSLRWDTNPPVGGEAAETTYADNDYSIRKYGVFEEIVSGGELEETGVAAEQIRDLYLKERSEPDTDTNVSFGGTTTSEVKVILNCLGYVHRLQRYYYHNFDPDELFIMDLSDKMKLVLNADPNVTITNASIYNNDTQVNVYEEGEDKAWSILTNMVNYSDDELRRYTMGIYEDRRFAYAPAPTTPYYFYSLTDRVQQVYDISGNIVPPWRVKPGRWLIVTDFLQGQGAYGDGDHDIYTDPRAMFIERVSYSSPWGLTIDGSKVKRIDQKLARLGLGGVI